MSEKLTWNILHESFSLDSSFYCTSIYSCFSWSSVTSSFNASHSWSFSLIISVNSWILLSCYLLISLTFSSNSSSNHFYNSLSSFWFFWVALNSSISNWCSDLSLLTWARWAYLSTDHNWVKSAIWLKYSFFLIAWSSFKFQISSSSSHILIW